eukprot:gene20174-31019_t
MEGTGEMRPDLKIPASKQLGFTRNVLLPWILENGAVVGLTLAARRVTGGISQDDFVGHLRDGMISSLIMVVLAMHVQDFFISYIYADVPSFAAAPDSHQLDPKKTLLGYFRTMLPSQMVSSICVFLLAQAVPPQEYAAKSAATFDLGDIPFFLAKLLIMRVVADVTFYYFHRLEHTSWLYWMHKQHHVHKTCHVVGSNFNFHFLDLFLEGFLPIFMGLVVLQVLGIPTAPIEEDLLVTYLVYFSSGTHAGKAVPTVNWFPPLSFITRPLGIDDATVLFHDNHHLVNNCNYGNSQWVDMLHGTRNVKPYAR